MCDPCQSPKPSTIRPFLIPDLSILLFLGCSRLFLSQEYHIIFFLLSLILFLPTASCFLPFKIFLTSQLILHFPATTLSSTIWPIVISFRWLCYFCTVPVTIGSTAICFSLLYFSHLKGKGIVFWFPAESRGLGTVPGS